MNRTQLDMIRNHVSREQAEATTDRSRDLTMHSDMGARVRIWQLKSKNKTMNPLVAVTYDRNRM